MSNEIEVVQDSQWAIMPVMSMSKMIQRRQSMIDVKSIMVADVDYGIVPGTTKPTLLKPGAEKLVSFFGLSNKFDDAGVIEDWTGKDHDGEPFFYYRQRCSLYRGAMLVASADGSSNSWESKHRYRTAQRLCPNCGTGNVMRSKYPPRDNPNAKPETFGWYCNAKSGGCGANFPPTDPAIVKQETGRKMNPDPADLCNTILKMAQKRALVAATLIAVNASEFFTQDIEDMKIAEGQFRVVDEGTGEVKDAPTPATVATITGNGKPQPAVEPVPLITEGQRKLLNQLGSQIYGVKPWDAKRHELVQSVTKGRTDTSAELTTVEADTLISGLERKKNQLAEEAKAKVPATPAPTDGDHASMLEEAAAANDHSSWGAQAL